MNRRRDRKASGRVALGSQARYVGETRTPQHAVVSSPSEDGTVMPSFCAKRGQHTKAQGSEGERPT